MLARTVPAGDSKYEILQDIQNPGQIISPAEIP
jgi:hypothetical protein